MRFTLLNLFLGLMINSMQSAAREEGNKVLDTLSTDIREARDLEYKIETTLEDKVDFLVNEIKNLKAVIDDKDKKN